LFGYSAGPVRVHSVLYVVLTGLVTLLLLQGCTGMQGVSTPDRLFRGDATFSKLTPAVRTSPLVTYCRPALVERIEFTTGQFPDKTESGRQLMRVDERAQGIAGVTVTGNGRWRPPGMADGSGNSARVISCGGLITLAFSESGAFDGKGQGCADPAATRRFAMTQVSEYTGTLFPPRVGNQLAFTFDALLRAGPAQSGCQQERRRTQAVFTVLGANDTFRIAGRRIPGRVYLVEGTLTDSDSGDAYSRDYYYAEALGWVVMVVEYDNGMPVRVMEMVDWLSTNGQ